MGAQTYTQTLAKEKLSTDPGATETVKLHGHELWVRMSQQKGAGQPEFLSTHPSDPTRIRQIEAWLPEALQDYKPR